jgi:hypothetical protein
VNLVSSILQQFPKRNLTLAQRSYKRRAVAVVGTSSSESVRGALGPSTDLFVYRVLHRNIEDYITEHQIEIRNLERTSKDGCRFMSFTVTVKVSDMNTLLPVLASGYLYEVFLLA